MAVIYCKNTPWKSEANNVYEVTCHVSCVGTANMAEHRTRPRQRGHLLKVNNVADKHCLLALGSSIMTPPLVHLGREVIRRVVQADVFVETFANSFLPRESLSFAWTVLLLAMWTTSLIIPWPNAPGTNLVLTFRTPRTLGPLFERMVDELGLILTTLTRGPRRPKFLFILSNAFFAFILVTNILIPLLTLLYTLRVAARIRV